VPESLYNRYIPGSNGVYERRSVYEPKENPEQCSSPQNKTPEEAPCIRHAHPRKSPLGGLSLDTGDLLLLCIVLLLLIDSDGEDFLPLLITAAAFLFMQ